VPPASARVEGAAPQFAPRDGAGRGIRAVWYNFYKLPPLRTQAEPMLVAHVRALRNLGINRIYALVKTPDGYVTYDSRLAPKWSTWGADGSGRRGRMELDWDPLAVLCGLGAEQGIDVQPYVNVFCEGGEEPESKTRDSPLARHPGWAMANRAGQRLGWASPAVPQVVDYELGILREIATRYRVSGIQLDRIRLPSGDEAGQETRVVRGVKRTVPSTVDYHPEAIRRFHAAGGRLREGRPEEADPAWVRFRQDLVTDFVRAARREIKRIRPDAALSAAVFPDPESAPRQQFQDWPRWVREGLLDAVCTMAYEPHAAAWKAIVERETEAVGRRIPLYAGIGADRFARPEPMAAQVAMASSLAVEGYVLFNAFVLLDKPAFGEAVRRLNPR
jgi:uncharacterized lipoprotein YddW (UPF0748 family)